MSFMYSILFVTRIKQFTFMYCTVYLTNRASHTHLIQINPDSVVVQPWRIICSTMHVRISKTLSCRTNDILCTIKMTLEQSGMGYLVFMPPWVRLVRINCYLQSLYVMRLLYSTRLLQSHDGHVASLCIWTYMYSPLYLWARNPKWLVCRLLNMNTYTLYMCEYVRRY